TAVKAAPTPPTATVDQVRNLRRPVSTGALLIQKLSHVDSAHSYCVPVPLSSVTTAAEAELQLSQKNRGNFKEKITI
ncbi:hypothetical protein ACW4FQ_25260, partial [Escherichia coli]